MSSKQSFRLTAQVRQESSCLTTHSGVTHYIYMPETPDFPYTAKQREGLVDLLERSKGVFRLVHRPQLTRFCQIMPPAPKLLPILLGYGRLSVCTYMSWNP